MRIVVTGATGFVGRALVQTLLGRGDSVVAWSRDKERASSLLGPDVDVVSGDGIDSAIDGADAVVNLAGEPIVGRWTAAKKQRVLSSRVGLTRRVVDAIRDASLRPRVFVSASAIGVFQTGFLKSVCEAWESEATAAESIGLRVFIPRIGLVLGREGGMLASMSPAFRAGLGGRLGSGEQGMSWIHLDDLIRFIVWGLTEEAASGPMTATAPNPVSNAEFTVELGRVLSRPTWFRVPAFALRLALGDASTLLLDSPTVRPTEALEHGFDFHFKTLPAALEAALGIADAPEFSRTTPLPSEIVNPPRAASCLTQTVRLDAPIDEVFDFFSAAANLGLMTPSWMGFRILDGPSGPVSAGDHIRYRIRLGPIPMTWLTEIRVWEPGIRFVDNQLKGPYALWWHEHRFEPDGDGTLMIDQVTFRAPLGPLGRIAEHVVIRSMLKRIFAYRASAIRRLFPGRQENETSRSSPDSSSPIQQAG